MFARQKKPPSSSDLVVMAGENTVRPKPRPIGKSGADIAVLPAVKLMPVARPEQDLGDTIVALGPLGRSGLWLRTPLVRSEVKGRVVYAKTGAAANVLLLPLKGVHGAGSQLSLAAMQVLGMPLAELAKIQVFVR